MPEPTYHQPKLTYNLLDSTYHHPLESSLPSYYPVPKPKPEPVPEPYYHPEPEPYYHPEPESESESEPEPYYHPEPESESESEPYHPVPEPEPVPEPYYHPEPEEPTCGCEDEKDKIFDLEWEVEFLQHKVKEFKMEISDLKEQLKAVQHY